MLDTLADKKASTVCSTQFSRIALYLLMYHNYDFFYLLIGHKVAGSYLNFNTLITLEDEKKYTVFSYIIKLGNVELTKAVLSYGDTKPFVNDNQTIIITYAKETPKTPDSPLYIASAHGHTEIMQLLMDRGALKNHGNDETPLHAAAKNYFSDAVMLLLSTPSVNIRLPANEGKTAYDYFLTNFQYYDNEGNFDTETAKRHHSIKDLHCLLSLAIAMGDNSIASQLLKDKDILSYEGEYQYLPLNFLIKTNNYTLIREFILSPTENNIKIDMELINFKGEKQLLFVELFKHAMKLNKLKAATLNIDKIKKENPGILGAAVFENNLTILEFIAKNCKNEPKILEILAYIITNIPFEVKESASFNERFEQAKIGSSETENHLLSFCLETISLQKIKRKRLQKRKLANN